MVQNKQRLGLVFAFLALGTACAPTAAPSDYSPVGGESTSADDSSVGYTDSDESSGSYSDSDESSGSYAGPASDASVTVADPVTVR